MSASKASARNKSGMQERSRTVKVPVYGMDCRSCADSVELAIGALPGVQSVKANTETSRMTVIGSGDTMRRDLLKAKIEELGYSAVDVKDQGPEEGASPADILRQHWKALIAFVVIGGAIIAGGIFAYQWSRDYYFGDGRTEDLTTFFSSFSVATIGLGFAFGLILAFSPFTFALAPAVMGYVASSKKTSRVETARLSAGFVGGIVTVDVILGALFASVGTAAIAFFENRVPAWYAVITVLLLGLGLIMLRIWKVQIPTFMPTMHKTSSVRGAYLAGVPFGLIACPACTPLLLPVVFGAAATGNALYGAALMGAFALGRGIPLVILGTSTGTFQRMKGFTTYVPWIERVVGVMLLAGAVFYAREFILEVSFVGF